MTEKLHTLAYRGLPRLAIFAHRGSSAHAPENTLAAFGLAIQQHADGLELDVKLSADGEVVVMHDDTVDRTTNGSGSVNRMTLAELKQLDAGSKFDPAYHAERIPTLAEVFEAFGSKVFINVEVKNYTSPLDDLPDKVIALVKEYNLENSVMLSSFNVIALIRARSLLPKIPLGLITVKGLADLTLRSKLVRLSPLLAFHPHYLDVTPEMIQATHRAGTRIHPYTVNQPESMRQLFVRGVDGIFSDDIVSARQIRTEVEESHR